MKFDRGMRNLYLVIELRFLLWKETLPQTERTQNKIKLKHVNENVKHDNLGLL